MPAKPTSTQTLHEMLDALRAAGGNKTAAAKALGIARTTLMSRLNELQSREATGKQSVVDIDQIRSDEMIRTLREEISELKAAARAVRRETLDTEYVRRQVFHLAESEIEAPEWLVREPTGTHILGVPTLQLSDWHWGEVVDPKVVNGVNEYNMTIARQRARLCVEKTIALCKTHLGSTAKNTPGIVVLLGGDMVTGDIHEDLTETNEAPIMAVVVDLLGVLEWCLSALADAFGQVMVVCVTGNHGRNTKKIRSKTRAHTSFDWLLYTMLERRFMGSPELGEKGDGRFRFLVPTASDAHYNIYGHRYCLTHGDQFRGGDGLIGALGPITRGDHKKRTRNMQIDLPYDTLVLCHWHQRIALDRLKVNGSLIGYNEWAGEQNFGFEIPQQNLWITHPTHGITFDAPVKLADRVRRDPNWISWRA